MTSVSPTSSGGDVVSWTVSPLFQQVCRLIQQQEQLVVHRLQLRHQRFTQSLLQIPVVAHQQPSQLLSTMPRHRRLITTQVHLP